MRPAMIAQKDPSLMQKLLGFLLGYVRVNDLARASITLATSGNAAAILENDDLVRKSKE